MRTVERGVLLARALATSAMTLAVATAAHVAGGGQPPPLLLLGLLGALLLAAAAPLARRSLRAAPLLAWAAAGQLVVHLTLSRAHLAAGTAVTLALHHGPGTAPAHGGAHPTTVVPMLAAHVIGTVVGVALVVATDRSACAARRHWLRVWTVLVGAPALPEGRILVAPRRTPRPALSAVVLGVLRRGPPVLLNA
ncbi:hypothetical protein Q6348_11780 [Isoptericola sp. b441]|uniref:MFS transporter n=1 Tax=Actinotalea lenta TaxID=3064654 RepID=A0ABT9DBC3_9CELL|nr:hypothetical protein [Isoptericola sp. b441]MDO8107875.1 hypothetical protein [Isoptericola sp. b441]